MDAFNRSAWRKKLEDDFRPLSPIARAIWTVAWIATLLFLLAAGRAAVRYLLHCCS